ncbi:hypothetical protein [Micromonospora noduli]|uniref:hypothetical protein n=1 Tax=Micromonospora noduli TaxID=709876 RepID=UPI000DC021DD|nr:hypothetical protein [Micromonospora noduli]RAO11572.1 hypothetical protein GUI43_03180 [Micromonospora noduli]
MLSKDTLAHLQDAAILWSVGSLPATDVIDAACDCLVAGVDSPTLRILAGISPTFGDESDELRRWLRDALVELSLAYCQEGSREGEEAAVRVMARRLLAGTITPSDLTSWAYRYITSEGNPIARELVRLDDSYELAQFIDTDMTALNAEVAAEARQLVESDPGPVGEATS